MDEKVYTTVGVVHKNIDAIPLSKTKIDAVQDLFENAQTRWEFFWKFGIYHDRWQELNSNDFIPSRSVQKGADVLIDIASPREVDVIDKSQVLEEDTMGVEYLRKIIEDCQIREIEVLLIYLPFPAGALYQREANRVARIAAEYGVNYINFLDMDIVDYKTDCYDSTHLNSSGAQKVTSYLGQYIREHYEIPDRRSDPVYASWYGDYKEYAQYKFNNLSSQLELKNYLMLLSDKHLSYCVYLKDNNMWHNGSQYEKLLSNAGIDSEALVSGGATLAVVDNVGGKVAYLSEGDAADTSFGTVSLVQMEDRKTHVLIDGTDSLNLTGSNIAGAVVIDNATGKAATSSKFAVAATSVNKVS